MSLRNVTDAELIAKARSLARQYRAVVADLVAVIAEVERRRLYRKASCSSAFDFCVRELELSEDDAAKLLRSARAASRHPEVLSYLAEGSLTARAVSILSPEVGKPDFIALLDRAKDKTLKAVEQLMAERQPAPAPREDARILSADASAGTAVYRLAFNADQDLKAKLERLKDLLSHRCPSGRLEDVLIVAVEAYLAIHDPLVRKPAEPGAVRNTKARRVPPSVRDAVWRRDKGRCAYVGEDGRRCEATRWLELDHIEPWALGGSSHAPDNIRLLCREHNQEEARRRLGGGAAPAC